MENLRILFATPCPPIPFGGGGSRMFYLIKYLSKLGVKIDLITLVNEENISDLNKVIDFCKNIYYVKVALKKKFNKIKKMALLTPYDYYNEFNSKLQKIVSNKYDLIQVEKFEISEYFAYIKNIPIIIDLWACGLKGIIHEFIYEKNIFKKAINLTRLIRYAISDHKYYTIFNNFFVVSKEAKDYINKYFNKKVFIVPMGVEIKENCKYSESNENILIFTGDMSFFQNIDTVKYFVNKIYKKIKREIKDVKFYVVGGYPTKEIINLCKKDKSIFVTGYVPDIKKYLYNSKVYVAPIRTGAGMRNKIVEAMACKKPVVATENAIEGIEANDGKELLIANEPNKFADCVIKLLKDENLRKTIGENAYNLVKEKYNWEIIAKKVIYYYKEILSF